MQSAFDNLKHCLCDAPVLALPDFDAHYEVVCDASGFGCGAVLLQNQKPIAFHSYKLSDAERATLAENRSCWRSFQHSGSGGATLRVLPVA